MLAVYGEVVRLARVTRARRLAFRGLDSPPGWPDHVAGGDIEGVDVAIPAPRAPPTNHRIPENARMLRSSRWGACERSLDESLADVSMGPNTTLGLSSRRVRIPTWIEW